MARESTVSPEAFISKSRCGQPVLCESCDAMKTERLHGVRSVLRKRFVSPQTYFSATPEDADRSVECGLSGVSCRGAAPTRLSLPFSGRLYPARR